MADEFNRYKEDNRIRLIVEEVIEALIKKCDSACSQLKKANERLDANERRIGELNAFLRRVAFLQRSIEGLQEQVQEVDSHRDMAETRRIEDIKEMKLRIDKVAIEGKNEHEILKGNIRKFNTVIEQCKHEMKDIVSYEKDSTRRVLALEATLTEMKESSKESIEDIRCKLDAIPLKFEQNMIEYKNIQTEVEMLDRLIKGIFTNLHRY